MNAGESAQARARKAPSAQCRLCSAVAVIEAPTTDQLRISLRRFMADHRHDGLADIVIDISDEAETPDEEPPVVSEAAGVSRL